MAGTGYYEDEYGYGSGEPETLAAAGAGQEPRASGLAALANWVGALVSVCLVVGMAVWAVQLTVRDVTGVPVIEALEGPMREPPADPGGTQAPHQGLAVNRIAEGAEAQPVPDRLVIAPPPVELRDVELVADASDADPSRGDALDAVATSESLSSAAVGAPVTDDAAPETAALIDRLLIEAQAASPGTALDAAAATPVEIALATGVDVSNDIVLTVQQDAAENVAALLPASVPGVSRSLRPAARPGGLRTVQSVSRPLTPEDTGIELAVEDLADGTRLVQLGAFDTPEIARAEWTRLAGQFPDFFVDRPRVIEEASSGGQAFFRLRAAGFDDLDGARRFCAVLVAQGAACIPVTVR